MKTEYNHGGAISNIWQDRNEFRWANRAGEGAESTFELAVQAAETALNPTAMAGDGPSIEVNEALAWSRGNATSYGVVTSTGWRGIRNRSGRCEDAPCCGCCTF